jgi:hypothetical protein
MTHLYLNPALNLEICGGPFNNLQQSMIYISRMIMELQATPNGTSSEYKTHARTGPTGLISST